MGKTYIIRKTQSINTDISKVFAVWTDIEKWHLWTKSVNSITFIGNKKFEIGSRVKAFQPKLPPAVWTITEVRNNELFVWQTKTFGVTIVAKHKLRTALYGTISESELIYSGLFACILRRLSKNLVFEYLTMEMDGLKKECEKQRQPEIQTTNNPNKFNE